MQPGARLKPYRTLSASGGGGCASSARPTAALPARPSRAANASCQLPPACCEAGPGSAAAAAAAAAAVPPPPPVWWSAALAAAGSCSQALAPPCSRRSSCAWPCRSIGPVRSGGIGAATGLLGCPDLSIGVWGLRRAAPMRDQGCWAAAGNALAARALF